MAQLWEWIPQSLPTRLPPTHTSQHSRTETLCEADSTPDTWGAGTGGSWWLNDTGDSVAGEVHRARGDGDRKQNEG